MRRKFEPDVLNQVYYFLKERMIYDKPSPHLCVIDFSLNYTWVQKSSFNTALQVKFMEILGKLKSSI